MKTAATTPSIPGDPVNSVDMSGQAIAYTITVSNAGDVPAQLIARHWVINDASGRSWYRETGKQPEVFIDIYPATDGWAGDGHKFREAVPSHTGYGKDTCGECGSPLDGDTYEYDPEQRRSVPSGKAHPNG